MSVVAVKIKIMPDSPEADMAKMEKNVKSVLEKNWVKNPSFEIQPIAFGLKAVIVMFGWPDEKSLDLLEEKLRKILHVSSVQVIDIRRAIG
ncbi:MAG TPA: elongation factor 1-beta [Candidatus Nanoarchaeia archaeon]|nr:elongation factor 1-beta [Candidatus Nanoarchaeia archaeon]